MTPRGSPVVVRYFKGSAQLTRIGGVLHRTGIEYCEPTDPDLVGVELRMGFRCIEFSRVAGQDLSEFIREIDVFVSFVEEAFENGKAIVGKTVKEALGLK